MGLRERGSDTEKLRNQCAGWKSTCVVAGVGWGGVGWGLGLAVTELGDLGPQAGEGSWVQLVRLVGFAGREVGGPAMLRSRRLASVPGEDSGLLPGPGPGKVESCQAVEAETQYRRLGQGGLPGWEAKGSWLGAAGRTWSVLEEGGRSVGLGL